MDKGKEKVKVKVKAVHWDVTVQLERLSEDSFTATSANGPFDN